ncbi:MAG: exodeoxyribonuclease VII large subunit [Schleiferiaceae bacterium]|nr:exodeoxyribonuclease VII large subunit [Schleiferiaceae bacterium]
MSYENTLTLRGLSHHIQHALGRALAANYWVRVEIHRLNVYGGTGHAYLELVEKENGRVVAKMSGTLWRDTYRMVSNQFQSVTGEPFRDGMQVLMQVQVRYHELYGLSLNVLQVDPNYSLGQMARMRLETISRLQQEGLFNNNRSLPLPETLTRIAVISGASSKGYKDFLHKVIDYTERYKLRIAITLFPALLDGQNAIDTIPRQMTAIEKQASDFDAICIIRGGGGEVGISAFDHYQLAAAVCSSTLPVFTGIGHATNETVTELVAHKNGITPTDVATFIGQHLLDAVGELELNIEKTFRFAQEQVFDAFQHLHNTSGNLEQVVKNKLLVERSELRELGMRVVVLPKRNIALAHQTLKTKTLQLEKLSERLLLAGQQQMANATHQISKHYQAKISMALQELQQMDDKVKLLDPLQVLKRGYSITRVEGKAVKSATALAIGTEIETELFEGTFTSKITEKNE